VREVLIRGLDPAPAARWPDLHALLAALGPALARRRRRARWPWLVGGLVALGAATTMAVVGNLSHDRSLGECAPADEVFGDAWSAERRAAVLRAQPEGDGIGTLILMDQARRQWLSTHTSVCRAPASEERSQKLTCLRLVRDDLARMASSLAASGSGSGTADVVSLSIAIGSCAPGPEGIPGAPLPPLPPR
jgi:hypothetical protein